MLELALFVLFILLAGVLLPGGAALSGGGWRAAKVPRFERAVRCLLAIQRGEAVGVVWMVDKLGLSLAQAKRDMLELERVLPVTRHKVVKNGRSFLMLVPRRTR